MTTIYLSSTYDDLKDHRSVVFDSLRKSGYHVIAMEDYVATDKRPVEKCLEDVARSDLYIGIFAFRYGYVPPPGHGNPDQLSITELEFRSAEKTGKPCLLFLANEKQAWLPVSIDAHTGENETGLRIKQLRKYLEQEKMASFFSGSHELASLVQAAITKWLEETRTAPAQPAAPAPKSEIIWNIEEKGSPYPGLMHFTRNYAPVFFGREVETREVLDRIVDNPFVLVSGDSGVGKSSLVDAGVLPGLEQGGLPGEKRCRAVRMLPRQGETPFDALLWALKPLAAKSGLEVVTAGRELTEDPGRLSKRLEQIVAQGMEEEVLVLFVDQMEELFTAHESSRAGEFLHALCDAAKSGPLRVVATLRSDHLHHCHDHNPMLQVLRGNGYYPLGRIEQWMMRDMIVKPASSAGLMIDDALADRMIRDTGAQPGNLPYLAFALDLLFRQRENGALSEQAYDAFGEVQGAITEHVREVEAKLREDHGRAVDDLLPRIFEALVVVEEENLPVRSRARKAGFTSDLVPAVEKLIKERLLTTEGEGEQSTISVAHEKLFEGWPALKRWIADNQDDLRQRAQLNSEARNWATEKQRLANHPPQWKAAEPALLREGAGWQKTRQWLKSTNPKLEGETKEFINRCRNRANRARNFRVALATLLLLLAGVIGVAVQYRNNAHLNITGVVDADGNPIENYSLRYTEDPAAGWKSLTRLGAGFLQPDRTYWLTVGSEGTLASLHRLENLKAGQTSDLTLTLLPAMALIEPQMVPIEPKEFRRGDISGAGHSRERPEKTLTIAKRFGVGKYEVTYAEYDLFVTMSGARKPPEYGWRGRYPVIQVSWHDARDYATWLSLNTGKRYRLPSEAEWEYVARAGSEQEYWWGDEMEADRAVCDGCESDWEGKSEGYPMAQVDNSAFEPNKFGLYHTAGNVWEWVEDCWHSNYEDAPEDGSAWLEANEGDCTRRVVRGGSWFSEPVWLRSAFRFRYFAGYRNFDIGFRLAQDL